MRNTATWLRSTSAGLLAVAALALTAGPAGAQLTYNNYPLSAPPLIGNNRLINELLTDRRDGDRAQAARQLGQSGNASAIPALARAAIQDPDQHVRREAREAIRAIRTRTGALTTSAIPYQPWGIQFQSKPVQGSGDPYVELVASWYNRFLGRYPDAAGMANWVNQLRNGASEGDVQAAMLASPEFWTERGGTPPGFVTGLYQTVLGRTPNPQEVQGWLTRFNADGGNRLAVAREFMQAAQPELSGMSWYYQH